MLTWVSWFYVRDCIFQFNSIVHLLCLCFFKSINRCIFNSWFKFLFANSSTLTISESVPIVSPTNHHLLLCVTSFDLLKKKIHVHIYINIYICMCKYKYISLDIISYRYTIWYILKKKIYNYIFRYIFI